MLKILALISLSTLVFAGNDTCLTICHHIAMEKCLKKCAETANPAEKCDVACHHKIQKPCLKHCQ
jgi:hypothetical protein